MKLEIKPTKKFKKDLKLAKKRNLNLDKIFNIIDRLSNQEQLEIKYRNHKLINYDSSNTDIRECHIEADWLLIYYIDDKLYILHLIRTGTHSDLF